MSEYPIKRSCDGLLLYDKTAHWNDLLWPFTYDEYILQLV